MSTLKSEIQTLKALNLKWTHSLKSFDCFLWDISVFVFFSLCSLTVLLRHDFMHLCADKRFKSRWQRWRLFRELLVWCIHRKKVILFFHFFSSWLCRPLPPRGRVSPTAPAWDLFPTRPMDFTLRRGQWFLKAFFWIQESFTHENIHGSTLHNVKYYNGAVFSFIMVAFGENAFWLQGDFKLQFCALIVHHFDVTHP